MNINYPLRIMVLIDDIWRVAQMISQDGMTGCCRAELNGMNIPVSNGQWYHIDQRLTDEQVHASVVQSNIDQLFTIVAQKANHQRNQKRLEERQAALLPAQPAAVPQPAPVVEQLAVQLSEGLEADIDNYYDSSDFDDADDNCNCTLCRNARGEL